MNAADWEDLRRDFPALADNVYLIPPKKNLTIFHGKLLLNDKVANQGINLPIDIFLRSLAEDQGERTIAIILSDMDVELTALEQQRDKTKAIKQGMMQELLTGRIRLT